MIEILIPKQHYELFDEKNEEFLPDIDIEETRIHLEHSLISLKKWEEKWHKPFLGKNEKTEEELIDYIRCMTLDEGVDQKVYNWIPTDEINKVIEYIKDPMTATWFSENALGNGQKHSREVVTAEIIYYWMITLSIPMECQEWHLNKLTTLIRVVAIKNGGEKKKDPRKAALERDALNKMRREKYKTKG